MIEFKIKIFDIINKEGCKSKYPGGMKMKRQVAAVLLAASVAASVFPAAAYADGLDGKYIILVPSSINAELDESHVAKNYSTGDYDVYLYDAGDTVTVKVDEDEKLKIREYPDNGTNFDQYTDKDGEISFVMPSSDLYLEDDGTGAESTDQTSETEAEVEDGKEDNLYPLNLYIPENTTAVINMVNGDKKNLEGPAVFQTDKRIADIKVKPTDSSKLSLVMKEDGKEFSGMGDLLSAAPEDGTQVTIDPRDNKDISGKTYEFHVTSSAADEKKETEVVVDAEHPVETSQTESDTETGTESEAPSEMLEKTEPTADQPEENTTEDQNTVSAIGSVINPSDETDAVDSTNKDKNQQSEATSETAPETASEAQQESSDSEKGTDTNEATDAMQETEETQKETDIEDGQENMSISVTIPGKTQAEIEMANGDKKTLSGPYIYQTNRELSFIKISKTEENEDLILTVKKDGAPIEDLGSIFAFTPLISDDGLIAVGFKKGYSLDGTYELNVDNGLTPASGSVGKLVEMDQKQDIPQTEKETEQQTEVEPKTGKTILTVPSADHTVKGIGTLNVRDIPSTDGERVGNLRGGDTVTVTGVTMENDAWDRVTYKKADGTEGNGFVKASYLN